MVVRGEWRRVLPGTLVYPRFRHVGASRARTVDQAVTAQPSITVLMPVYNAERHFAEALDSVLAQTYTDFELLCVEDGSTDSSPAILARYAAKDSRIRVLTNGENRGIAFSLNRGLEEARAGLIARMDSDDVSLPGRLALQAEFMSTHPDVLVCSGTIVLYETGLRVSLPLDDESVRICLLWQSPFCHPAAMFRREPVLAAGGYDASMSPAEDYELWSRLAEIPGWRFANLEPALLRYRAYPGEDRHAYWSRQRKMALCVGSARLAGLGITESGLDIEAHAVLMGFKPEEPVAERRLAGWVSGLVRHNREKGLFSLVLFEKLCNERVHSVAVRADQFPPWAKRFIPDRVKLIVKRLLFAGRTVFHR